MTPSAVQIAEIVAEMRRAGVTECEASAAGWSLHLSVPARDAPQPTAHRPVPVTVVAPCAGSFVGQHPMRPGPMAAPGATVRAGDILAVVAAGPLYRPVTAPCAGRVLRCLVGPGALVGYATPVFEIVAWATDEETPP